MPTSGKDTYNWLRQWLNELTNKFTKAKDEPLRPTENATKLTDDEFKEMETNNKFHEGDLVWVTYPDNDENKTKNYVGICYARIITPQTKGKEKGIL